MLSRRMPTQQGLKSLHEGRHRRATPEIIVEEVECVAKHSAARKSLTKCVADRELEVTIDRLWLPMMVRQLFQLLNEGFVDKLVFAVTQQETDGHPNALDLNHYGACQAPTYWQTRKTGVDTASRRGGSDSECRGSQSNSSSHPPKADPGA